MKTMIHYACFFVILLCVTCTENKKHNESNALDVYTNKVSYSVGDTVKFQIINGTDSTALFQQCASPTDIDYTVMKQNGETWQYHIVHACPAIYGPYAYFFEPGDVYESLFTINESGVFVIWATYYWYGRRDTLISPELSIQ
ncbi:hypothetical protein JNM05_12270 [bacterium]|nr:hypothetical protein [bacterium]